VPSAARETFGARLFAAAADSPELGRHDIRVMPRRPGDPAVLVAASGLIRAETGWTPRFPDLRDIVATAAAWRERHPRGYGT